jgi:hypothetical protein|tara:strand:+ start:10046 stop:10360 length:315 start_codon:yes stop_codon:yes gene_type:complete
MTGNDNKQAGLSSMKSAECEVNPVDKPTELYIAIRQMHHLSERIDDLYERMGSCSPTDSSAPAKDGRDKICLLEVLNEGPRVIRDHLDYQHQRITEIEQLIFNH